MKNGGSIKTHLGTCDVYYEAGVWCAAWVVRAYQIYIIEYHDLPALDGETEAIAERRAKRWASRRSKRGGW